MLRLDDLKVNDLVSINIRYDPSNIKRSVYKVLNINYNTSRLTLLSIISRNPGNHIAFDLARSINWFDHHEQVSVDDLVRMYTMAHDEASGDTVFKLKKPKKKVFNFTLDDLKKIFKYIPVSYNGYPAFYYNGNIIYKKHVTKTFKFNKRYNGTKRSINKTIIEIIPVKEEDVLNYYSEETIMSLCRIKIKDYVKSAKLFQYVAEKKELLGKTLDANSNKEELTFEALEIKIKDTVKKSDEPQNTISIDGKTRKLRFVMEDLEIIYPNINGWSKPKDRRIKEGNTVVLKDNRNLRNIPKNKSVVIEKIKEVGNKKYVGIKIEDKLVFESIRSFKLV